ncbi:molybdopterin converting factor subunit 1 [Chengkuizengella sediminis]|uniref:molybdopterin converting factor subunit 1 n=1 Tax=Chengkuizengella sediminis TaxID=1885917 RepID=UPI00138993CB|nr:molybdopterin converting factor subunit 1 [Chengkuizengella sediminis]NDI36139.1 molybdopterin converting factor subunit 1 [Chengkuizengella sediminis]
MIKILLFAGLADAAGVREIEIDLIKPSMTVESVKKLLKKQYSSTAFIDELDKSFASINQEYVDQNTAVSDHDEVAFIPPVSGG